MSETRTIESELFKLFNKLDFRDRNNSARKKFFGILLAYVFSNSILSFNFFNVFDRESYMVLAFTSGLFLMAILVLNDFDDLILAGRSFRLISGLPVDTRTFFEARFRSSLLFIFPFALVSSVPQSIFFYFYRHSAADASAFFTASFCFNMFVCGFLILLYSAVILKFPDKAGGIMTLMQIVFFMFVFYSSTVATDRTRTASGSIERATIMDKPAVEFLPQALLAGSVDKPWLLSIPILLTAGVLLAGKRFLSSNFAELSLKAEEMSVKRRNRKMRFRFPVVSEGSFIRDNLERAAYRLTARHLSNSRFLRIKYIPYYLMPWMFIITGIIFDIPGLILAEGKSGLAFPFETIVPLLSPSILIFFMMSMRMLVSNTKIMDDVTLGTEWIYKVLPQTGIEKMLNGVWKYFAVTFLLPSLLILFAVILYKGGLYAALLNTAFAGSGLWFVNSVAALFDKTPPFTIESGKFNSASKLGEIFIAMFLGILLFLIQIFAFQNIIFALASIAVFSIVSILLNRN